MALQHLRSGTANKRPIPTAMSDGQLAVNTNLASPGLFFKDSNGDLVKAGPVHVGTTAPNASPASTAATALVANTIYQILTIGTSDFTAVGASANTVGVVFTATGTTTGTGTVSGQQGNEKGEQWLDTTNSLYEMKVYDGTGWQSVTETISLADGTASAPSLHFGDDTNTGLYSPSADSIGLATNGVERLNIDSTGSVVVPGTLTSTGNITASDIIINSAGTAAAPSYRFALGTGFFSATGTGNVAISTVSTERLVVDSSGKVGIGISTPEANSQLHVVGSGYNPLYLDTSNAGGGGISLRQGNVNALYVGTGGSSWLSGSATTDGLVRAEANLLFTTGGNNERLRIDSSGRVGIGTTSPSHQLTVHNASTTDGTIEANRFSVRDNYGNVSGLGNGFVSPASNTLAFATNSTERMRIYSDGGISFKKYLEFRDGGDTTYAGYLGSANHLIAGGANTDFTLRAEANLLFASGGSNERMRIDSSGNVGIGNAAPAQKLHVAGKIRYGANTTYYGEIEHDEGSTGANIYNSQDTGGHIFKNSGSEKLRIDNSGNVGIGNVAPAAKLHLEATSEQLRITHTSIVSYRHEAHSNGDYSINKDGTERMRIDSSGRLLVGRTATTTNGARTQLSSTASPVLSVNNTTTGASNVLFQNASTGDSTLDGLYVGIDSNNGYLWNYESGALIFGASAGERMRIDNSGVVEIGKSTASAASGTGLMLYPTAAPFYAANKSASGNHNGIIFYSGSTYVGGLNYSNSATTLVASSDYRLKENIAAIPNAIARAKQLNPIQFNFIADPDETTEGFLAHEVGEVVPLACFGEKDAVDEDGSIKPQSLSQVSLIPLLTAALKEAITKIETLEQRLSDAGIA